MELVLIYGTEGFRNETDFAGKRKSAMKTGAGAFRQYIENKEEE